MSEQLAYTYPEQEHREEPVDYAGRLMEEMRLYPTSADFLSCIKGLVAIHGNTNLGVYIRWASDGLSKQYTRQFDMVNEHVIYDRQFLAGGVLGLHVASRGLPYGMAKDIHYYYDETVESVFSDEESGPNHALNMLSYLEKLYNQDEQSDEIMTLRQAAALFNPEADEDQQHFFVLGYIYGVDVSQSLLSKAIPQY